METRVAARNFPWQSSGPMVPVSPKTLEIVFDARIPSSGKLRVKCLSVRVEILNFTRCQSMKNFYIGPFIRLLFNKTLLALDVSI